MPNEKVIPASGVRGITWNDRYDRWQVQINYQGMRYSLGYFARLDDAIKMREKAEDETFKDFDSWYENDYKAYKKSLRRFHP